MDRETAEAAPEQDEAPVRDVRRTRAEPGEVAPTAPRRVLTPEERRERHAKRTRNYNAANRGKSREYAREYRAANIEECRKREGEYRASHPEKKRERERRRYAAHPQNGREKARRYRTEHPEEHLERNRRRRTITRSGEFVGVPYLYERDRGICQICFFPVPFVAKGRHPLRATPDHIIPLKPARGATHPPGEHSKRNCRLAHLKCNVSRGNRHKGEPMLDLDESGQYRTRKESP